jgi:hypothetical protein
VKIRDSQYVDIHVEAITSDRANRSVSLEIEVKGCWHPDLKTALNTQLAQRYLHENRSPFGIFLVVWFLCEKWHDQDTRKAQVATSSLDLSRSIFHDQAHLVLRATGANIRAFVLDGTIP